MHQQFPDLAIIVAGRREDDALLAPLIATGVIFRRMDNPPTAETIRNLVDATQYRSRPNADAPAVVPRTALATASVGTRPAFKLSKICRIAAENQH